MPLSRTETGILLSLCGYTAWVVGDTLVKLSSESLSIPQMLTVNSLSAMVFMFLAACFNGGYRQLATRRYVYQFICSVFNAVSGFAAFIAISYLTLADFYTIVFTAPLMMTILAWILLKERTNWKIWLAIVFGFLGVVVAMRWSNNSDHPLSWIGVALTGVSVLSFCFSMLMVRAAPGENNYALSFWPRLLAAIFTVAYLLSTHDLANWNMHGVIYATLSGAGLALGNVLNNLSLRYAAVSVVAPYHYTQIIGGAIAGYLIWHNVPGVSIAIGAVMVVLSGLFILRHQRSAAEEFAVGPT